MEIWLRGPHPFQLGWEFEKKYCRPIIYQNIFTQDPPFIEKLEVVAFIFPHKALFLQRS